MSLPTTKTGGKPLLEQIRLLLFGPPKIGKSTLASGFPDALFLVTENRHSHLRIFKKTLKKWEDFQEVLDEILEGKHKFQTIVIDTIDLLWTMCVDYMCEKMEIDHPSDEDWGKGYDQISKEFEREINKLILSDLALIFISHTKTIELTNRGGKFTKTVPSLPNQARRIVIPKMGLIGYYGLDLQQDKDKKFKEVRTLSFDSSEFLEAGDGEGKMPLKVQIPKDPIQAYKIFERAYSS